MMNAKPNAWRRSEMIKTNPARRLEPAGRIWQKLRGLRGHYHGSNVAYAKSDRIEPEKFGFRSKIASGGSSQKNVQIETKVKMGQISRRSSVAKGLQGLLTEDYQPSTPFWVAEQSQSEDGELVDSQQRCPAIDDC